jgi:hypothetical protein
MPLPDDLELRRLSAESQAHILASHASCEDSLRHVRASRGAIQRSLRLLSAPFHRGDTSE